MFRNSDGGVLFLRLFLSQMYKVATFIQHNWKSSEIKPIYSFHVTLAYFEWPLVAHCLPSWKWATGDRPGKEGRVSPSSKHLHFLSFLEQGGITGVELHCLFLRAFFLWLVLNNRFFFIPNFKNEGGYMCFGGYKNICSFFSLYYLVESQANKLVNVKQWETFIITVSAGYCARQSSLKSASGGRRTSGRGERYLDWKQE